MHEVSRDILEKRFLLKGQSIDNLFYSVAKYHSSDPDHADRLYDYMSKGWFMPSTPILGNSTPLENGKKRGDCISCFINEFGDSMEDIIEGLSHNMTLCSAGGGISTYMGHIRSIGQDIKDKGTTNGIVPFIKMIDTLTHSISQGALRRGAGAVYLPVNHPEIETFLEIRKPMGGDPYQKCMNIHHGVCLDDDFMFAVKYGEKYALKFPDTNVTHSEVDARALWNKILSMRLETGEPYLFFTDNVKRGMSEEYKEIEAEVNLSNLCSEILLDTRDTTAVCCLASVNLLHYIDWRFEELFIEDILRFLDNVLTDFCNSKASESCLKGIIKERNVGLGVMGYHSYLQSKGVAFDSEDAERMNKSIFDDISNMSLKASVKIAKEEGVCEALQSTRLERRFCNKTAVAPTATISLINNCVSAGIEPYIANCYSLRISTGSYLVKNQILEKLLEEKGLNTEETWNKIIADNGSVQRLIGLSKQEKEVFKTAYEIDQKAIIKQASWRKVDQSQSLNIFVDSNITKQELHDLHYRAWQAGIKTMYYVRSRSMNDADDCTSCQ